MHRRAAISSKRVDGVEIRVEEYEMSKLRELMDVCADCGGTLTTTDDHIMYMVVSTGIYCFFCGEKFCVKCVRGSPYGPVCVKCR